MPQSIASPDDKPWTENRILGGQVVLRQPARGYRVGMDGALLAAACGTGQRIFEAGCGVGGALLATARRQPDAQLVGLERDPEALGLARQNIALNGLEDRAQALSGDVSQPFRILDLAPFDAVMANPPFFDDPATLRAPAPEKTGAWMADGGLAAWTGFLIKAVRDGGSLTLIHRADRLADLLALLAPKTGSFQIRPVQPHADAPAKRVILRAIKTGKAPLALLPPLILHPREGAKHTEETEAILRGEARLDWL